jgi:ubiquinone/menaquinone biosynthesis C-methylase UbiE
MKQKNIFLKSEADAWFARNKENLSRRNFEDDNIVRAISDISKSSSNTMLKILEIGCGGGERLNYISNSINCSVSGVDPSLDAVNHCKLNNIDAIVGTADSLTHKDNAFDIVIFGFCLYLCDRGDLFRISTEADRVLKKEGWIIIQDFFAESPIQNEYHHTSGIKSYKMDYKTLFTWHPDYTCYQTKVYHHESQVFTDSSHEWVETSVIRRKIHSV